MRYIIQTALQPHSLCPNENAVFFSLSAEYSSICQHQLFKSRVENHLASGVTSSISEEDIFIYLCSAKLISFEIDSLSKELNCAEQEYMNMSPPLVDLATPMHLASFKASRVTSARGSGNESFLVTSFKFL